MTRHPSDRGGGFLEMALVLILVAVVLITILALLGPEITNFIERIWAIVSDAQV